MRVLVTGAGGFLGRYVVASVAGRGDEVRALVRPASTSDVAAAWERDPRISIVRGDLRDRKCIDAAVQDVDAVIHLAATKAGDLYEQFAGTVLATENLLDAMRRADVRRIVLTSSFSVYEYLDLRSRQTLDEASPLAMNPADRDEYCQTKLEQERLVREFVGAGDGRSVILRPGVIFGRENLWTARLGMQCGSRWWIRTGARARLPLTYVENCAEAVARSLEYEGPDPLLVVNIVDDEIPTQRAYMNAIRQHELPRPRVAPIPWTVMRSLARLAWITNRIMFGGTAKVPGVLVPARLHARCRPLRYSNRKARVELGWSPRIHWREGIDLAVRGRGDGRERESTTQSEQTCGVTVGAPA